MTHSLKFSPRLKYCIKEATVFANSCGRQRVFPVDLLYCLLGSLSNFISYAADVSSFDVDGILPKLKSFCETVSFSKKDKQIDAFLQKEATVMAVSLNHDYIGVEDAVLACLETNPVCKNFFFINKLDNSKFIDHLKEALDSSTAIEKDDKPAINKQYPNLHTFCEHVNERILDPDFRFYGREREIKRMMRILMRRQKSNIMLIGDAGVGKSCLVEGLAYYMTRQDKNNDEPIIDMDIYELRPSSLVAGAAVRGEFEKRLNGIISELNNFAGRPILFIDEIHTIIGAGDSQGATDMANMLKPALARGSFCCIGATTFDEYKKSIEQDPALCRRFEILYVDEPSREETLAMLLYSKSGYENYHGVQYDDDVIKFIMECSDKINPSRKFPDKAFDLLDEVGSKTKISSLRKSDQMIEVEKKLLSLKPESKERNRIFKQYERIIAEWFDSVSNKQAKVSKEDVLSCIRLQYPNITIGEDISSTVLVDKLSEKIIGQEEAVSELSDSLSICIHGLNDQTKPKCAILLAGPSGSGKTHTVRALSSILQQSNDRFFQFDLSQYLDNYSISKLIGTSAGYIGYDQGGLLTEKVKHNPHCVLLFDKIDRCSPDILNIFLQILENGHITDNQGRLVDFRNCYIFFETNAVSFRGSLGFSDKEHDDVAISLKKDSFRSDFLTRIQNTVYFRPLAKNFIEKIIRLELNSFPALSHPLVYQDDLVDFLMSKIDIDLGARNVKSIIGSLFTPNLARFFSANGKKDLPISAKVLDNTVVFSYILSEN